MLLPMKRVTQRAGACCVPKRSKGGTSFRNAYATSLQSASAASGSIRAERTERLLNAYWKGPENTTNLVQQSGATHSLSYTQMLAFLHFSVSLFRPIRSLTLLRGVTGRKREEVRTKQDETE